MKDFADIRKEHDLISVASRYIHMEKKGAEYVALCPFHEDTKPSLTFYNGRDGLWRFRCFACGSNGDVLDFVAGMNSCEVQEAARILTGDSMPDRASFQPPPKKPTEEKCWEPIIPVPNGAPDYDPAKTYNPKAGAFKNWKVTRKDCYRDAEGRIICYVVRMDFEDGNKITPVVTFCEGPGGERRWCAQRMKPPYPLMGLDDLAAKPKAHVLLVSGEKCREAVAAVFTHMVCMTTMGGDEAADMADFSPLDGRDVVFFPDADITGRYSMLQLTDGFREVNP